MLLHSNDTTSIPLLLEKDVETKVYRITHGGAVLSEHENPYQAWDSYNEHIHYQEGWEAYFNGEPDDWEPGRTLQWYAGYQAAEEASYQMVLELHREGEYLRALGMGRV